MKATDSLTREPTFAQWLFFYRDAGGAVGAVARFAAQDLGCWPKRARTVTHFIDHLDREHGAGNGVPGELELRAAFNEYRDFLRSGKPLPSRQGDRHGRYTKRVQKYLSLAEETPKRLTELTSPTKRPDGKVFLPGEVVDMAVAREHARVFRQKAG